MAMNRNVIILKPMRPIYYVNGDSRVASASHSKSRFVREDVVYTSQVGDFLQGNPCEEITIANHVNLLTNCSRTVARVTDTTTKELIREVTSDAVSKLIGQKSYDSVFAALCSVINQEIKVRGIMALLTVKTRRTSLTVCKEDKEVQTLQSCIDFTKKTLPKKRVKRKLWAPYAIKDQVRLKVEKVEEEIATCPEDSKQVKEYTDLPELKGVLSDDSNSNCSLSSNFSANIDNILTDPEKVLNQVLNKCTEDQANLTVDIKEEKNTNIKKEMVSPGQPVPNSSLVTNSNILQINPMCIELLDGSRVMVTSKPEDNFHIATPEILKDCTNEEKQKLIEFQAFIDFKCCLQRDADDLLPIHIAVLNDDLAMLRRQCIVLKHRGESLDITVDNMTPLQMSIHQDPRTTAVLLQRGADPLYVSDEQRTILHYMASENAVEHARLYLEHCRERARQILSEHEDLWKPGFESRSDDELAQGLMTHLCSAVDGQGYTPLMTSARAARPAIAALLLRAAPDTVDMPAPNSGSTALYLAVSEACIDVVAKGDKTKIPENYKKTIELLFENGANHTIKNYSGLDVNDLLTDNNISAISQIVSNCLAAKVLNNHPVGYNNVMLVKDEHGKVKVEDLIKKAVTNARKRSIDKPRPKEKKVPKEKAIIVEDVLVTNDTKKMLPNIDNRDLKVINIRDKIVSKDAIASASQKRQIDSPGVSVTAISQMSKGKRSNESIIDIPIKKRAYVRKKP